MTAKIILCWAALFSLPLFFHSASVPKDTEPAYTSEGELKFPEKYREWIYLTSGLDMSYNPKAMASEHSMFDNVFVNPEAYASFMKTGTWPDHTMLVLEVREAGSRASINQRGHFQTPGTMAVEVHVKDEARFPGKWAFFGFEGAQKAQMVPTTANCYSCHRDHGAVDTTFVQFYPTLIDVAKGKGTLSAAYLKEENEAAKK
jgi:Cytochrome P460